MVVRVFSRRFSPKIPILLISIIFLAVSCAQPFELKDLVDGPDGKGLIVSPVSAVLQVNGSLSMDVSGGIPPYQYMVVSGDGSFVGNQYYAPPSPGTERIRVRDRTGRTHESVIIVENPGGLALGIAPKSATVYTGQTIEFSALGGDGGISYTLDGNASGGTLTGNVYTAGPAAGTDTVTVTDAGGHSASATVTVVQNPVGPPATDNVNYLVSGVPSGGIRSQGSSLTAQFTVLNAGTADGKADVSWKAYLSPHPSLFSGGVPFATGQFAGLAAGHSRTVDVAGATWADPGTWYIQLHFFWVSDEPEENKPNNWGSSGAYSIIPASLGPNYIPSAVTWNLPYPTTGSAVEEEFTLANMGLSGPEPVTWEAYASVTQSAATGTLIGTGTVSNPPGSLGSMKVPVLGARWPDAPGQYYLIIKAWSANDTSPDDFTVSEHKFTVNPPPEYSIQGVTYPTGGARAGDPVTEVEFSITNLAGAGPGRRNIHWEACLSLDDGFSADDLPLGSGQIAPLALGSSFTITPKAPDLGGVWPGYGRCRILIRVSAADAVSPTVSHVSPPIELYFEDREGSGGGGTPRNDAKGPLEEQAQKITVTPKKGQTLVIRGWQDTTSGFNGYDTFFIDLTGSGISTISLYATHTPNTLLVLNVWNGSGTNWDSYDWPQSSHPTRRPGIGTLEAPYVWGDEKVFFGIYSNKHNATAADTYTIYIKGE